MILNALAKNTQFFSAALPLRIVPPLFNRYAGGEQYGKHIDGMGAATSSTSKVAVSELMRARTSSMKLWTDATFTVTAVASSSNAGEPRGLLLDPRADPCTGGWSRPILGWIARPSVAGCRIGGLPFVVGLEAVIGTARN